MARTWMHDVAASEAVRLAQDMQAKNAMHNPPGSCYETGKPRSGKQGQLGIYFSRPKA